MNSAAALLLLLLGAANAVPLSDSEDKCGYESCPVLEEGVLNVHIVPHTHDDVGWLKTVDQYYYGSRNSIQKAGVQYILDSVIRELWEDPSRRFIYVETAFFWKWWQRQHDAIRHKVHQLVRQGRLEFIGGAWSMNDEADTHYQSTIDQFTWGLRKLNETFGECGRPRIGWQIDPFGHSRELASLLAGMGYDGLFHGRIDYQDKDRRKSNKTMEMIWRGNDDLGSTSDLFTGVLYNTYSPPPGFCFDVLCQDEPIIDDVDSVDYNVQKRVEEFLGIVRNMSRAYRSPNILVTMGEDFNYQDARMWFANLDLLIKYTNMKAAKDKLNIKLFYSTPSCYLKAVNDAKPSLPTKQDDFFPYASDPHAYWTGYFTSRPTIKYFERRGNAYLQMVKQLQVSARLEEHNRFLIDELRSVMGVMQHHDAVTGTEKQHVSDDYARMLDEAVEEGLFVVKQAIGKLTEREPLVASILDYKRCQLNISQCSVTEDSRRFIVTAYNPLAWSVRSAVRIPVTSSNLTVRDPKAIWPIQELTSSNWNDDDTGETVESQMVELPAALLSLPTRRSSATHELVFLAQLPSLGYVSYYVDSEQTEGTRTKRQASLMDMDIPVDDFGPAPLTTAEKQRKLTMDYITQYVVARDKLRKEGLLQDLPTTPDYDIDISEYSDRDSTNDQPAIDPVLTYPALQPDFRKMVEESEKSLEKFRKSTGDGYSDLRKKEQDGYKFVKLSSLSEERMLGDAPMLVQVYSEDDFIENEHMRVKIDRLTGEFTNVVLADGTDISFDIDLLYYPGWEGSNNIAFNRASGAYIFRPNATKPTPLSNRNTTKIIKGPIVQEIHHEYSDYASSVTRLYKNSQVIEFEWLVGPIPVKDKIGKEIIVRYNTNLSNSNTFYTDSNGRQSLKRILNKRPQWDLHLVEPISGNYYPVTSKIYIEDLSQKVRFAVMNDRAQGGTSLNEGQVELMLHRRLLHDDAFGVGEALNETACGVGLVARGKHFISVGMIDSKQKQAEKKTALEVLLSPEVLVTNASISFDSWRWLQNEWSPVKTNLPDGVHLLTLEPWKAGTVLLRLEHIYEKTDLSKSDGAVTVDLSKLFANLTLTSIQETSLAANQWWKDRKKFAWDKEGEFSARFNDMYGGDVPAVEENVPAVEDVSEREATDGFVIELKPMEIRTFVVTIA